MDVVWGCSRVWDAAESPLTEGRSAGTGRGYTTERYKTLDDDHLNVDLGKAKWLTPQIDHLGKVKISYTYSGAEPSLE